MAVTLAAYSPAMASVFPEIVNLTVEDLPGASDTDVSLSEASTLPDDVNSIVSFLLPVFVIV